MSSVGQILARSEMAPPPDAHALEDFDECLDVVIEGTAAKADSTS
jgi:hypothetical protein